MHSELSSKILEALAKLDQKGTDERITQAMTIVFDAFRLNAAKLPFSAGDLVSLSLIQDRDAVLD